MLLNMDLTNLVRAQFHCWVHGSWEPTFAFFQLGDSPCPSVLNIIACSSPGNRTGWQKHSWVWTFIQEHKTNLVIFNLLEFKITSLISFFLRVFFHPDQCVSTAWGLLFEWSQVFDLKYIPSCYHRVILLSFYSVAVTKDLGVDSLLNPSRCLLKRRGKPWWGASSIASW